jgi:pyruvate kinase
MDVHGMDKTTAEAIAALHKERLGQVRTKIVATVGPASNEQATLRAMVEAGVDVFRLNFSHGSHDEHSAVLETIRRIELETGRTIAILQDLCGPKIRLGSIPGDVVACDQGSQFVLSSESGPVNDPHHLTSNFPNLADDLEVGQTVLFADGTVAMDVVQRRPGWARLVVVLPGQIRSHQGINLPSAGLKVRALTDKDLVDLDWTAKHSVDYVGLSFVREANDIVLLRQELDRRGSRARILAKIEKPQALKHLDSIIAEADAVMIARGDLGVEVDIARVPASQKQIIGACHRARVPVITATQMLNSMETTSRPTRAEVSDVFNAVLEGSDAVMLSGETAIGRYPVESVTMMSRIVSEAETVLFSKAGGSALCVSSFPNGAGAAIAERNQQVARAGKVKPITESVVAAASLISRQLDAALLAVATYTGRTALALSKQRNGAPTLALAHDVETARAMALFWGVTPLLIPQSVEPIQLRPFVLEWCKSRGLLGAGDVMVGIRGALPAFPNHNEIVVHVVEE